MRIVNIKKFVRSIIVVLFVIFILSLIITKSTLSHKEITHTIICVNRGDTLWNISKQLQENNNYYKGKDIRYIINDIVKVNNLQTSTVYENQELLIPTI